jgi:hypothetical protein
VSADVFQNAESVTVAELKLITRSEKNLPVGVNLAMLNLRLNTYPVLWNGLET